MKASPWMTGFESRCSRAIGEARLAGAYGLLALLLTLLPVAAQSGAREQAARMHARLAGVPPTETVLSSMATDIANGQAVNAAMTAMQNDNFYTVVLKNFAMPWTNRAQTQYAPLNDYVATVIGMVRDDVPFNTLLSADLLYVGAAGQGLPAYSNSNNDHYAQLESNGAHLGDKAVLVQTTQSSVTGIPAAATAGIMTTRAAAQAFFTLGTNRAMFRFTLINHFCKDVTDVMDASRPPDRIRQDVSRSPGGDSRVFMNNCIGCHSGMDPMAQAFAYYDFVFTTDPSTGSLQYTPGKVVGKYFHNNTTFPTGFVTPDDSWTNRWRAGPNSLLGWSASLPGSGAGAKSLGTELGTSDQFAQCQVQKVFAAMCLRPPSNDADRTQVKTMVGTFKSQGYKLKRVFADAAAYCSGT